MLIDWQMLADIATAIGVLLTGVGLFYAGGQLGQAKKQLRLAQEAARDAEQVQRAQFLIDTTKWYFANEDVRRLYYAIDYGIFGIAFVEAYDKRGNTYKKPTRDFLGSDEERWLDELLYTIDVIARVGELGILKSEDAQLFAFQANRVFKNPVVMDYLDYVDHDRQAALEDIAEEKGRHLEGKVLSHQAGRSLSSKAYEELLATHTKHA